MCGWGPSNTTSRTIVNAVRTDAIPAASASHAAARSLANRANPKPCGRSILMAAHTPVPICPLHILDAPSATGT